MGRQLAKGEGVGGRGQVGERGVDRDRDSERERERESHLNHFYFEGDGFRPWPNLPTYPLSMHI